MKKDFKLGKSDALVIVDVQRDFCIGGALPVPAGDQVVPVLNDYIKMFKTANAEIFATRYWHPPNHVSFRAHGGPWPPHCIRGSDGAKFHPDLKLPNGTSIVSKAMDPFKESYSGFDDTTLADRLKQRGVTRVFVGGLATEYCVKNTVSDAIEQGFETVLLLDATRGTNAKPNEVEKAVDEIVAKGAREATLADFPELPEIPQGEKGTEKIEEKPLTKADRRRKARLRSRGPYRKARIEH